MQQGLTETALITLWFVLTNQLLQCISITCTYTHFLIVHDCEYQIGMSSCQPIWWDQKLASKRSNRHTLFAL